MRLKTKVLCLWYSVLKLLKWQKLLKYWCSNEAAKKWRLMSEKTFSFYGLLLRKNTVHMKEPERIWREENVSLEKKTLNAAFVFMWEKCYGNCMFQKMFWLLQLLIWNLMRGLWQRFSLWLSLTCKWNQNKVMNDESSKPSQPQEGVFWFLCRFWLFTQLIGIIFARSLPEKQREAFICSSHVSSSISFSLWQKQVDPSQTKMTRSHQILCFMRLFH